MPSSSYHIYSSIFWWSIVCFLQYLTVSSEHGVTWVLPLSHGVTWYHQAVVCWSELIQSNHCKNVCTIHWRTCTFSFFVCIEHHDRQMFLSCIVSTTHTPEHIWPYFQVIFNITEIGPYSNRYISLFNHCYCFLKPFRIG